MEIAALTAFLAPFLPRLLKPAQDAAGDAVERLGEKSWEYAQKLWNKLNGKVKEKPAAIEVALEVADAPDDDDARAALAWQLKKLLNEDEELLAQVRAVWDEAERDPAANVQVIASGERAVAVGRDSTGNITTGDTKPASPPN